MVLEEVSRAWIALAGSYRRGILRAQLSKRSEVAGLPATAARVRSHCHCGTLQHPCPPLGWRSFSRVFADAKRFPEFLWRSLRAFAHHAFKVTRTLAG